MPTTKPLIEKDFGEIEMQKTPAPAIQQNTTDRLKEFAKLVQEMREAQNDYFTAIRGKFYETASGFLKKSKQLEREVDHAASQIIAGVEQTKLFV